MNNDKIRPLKRLGQNFLVNDHVLEKIISQCNFKKDDAILEIGPGMGVLTKRIASKVKEVTVVEKDKRSIEYLKNHIHEKNLLIVHEDILKFGLDKFNRPVKVVGNIPYNICTPILEWIFLNKDKISEAYLTVQLEFGQRIIAKEGSKNYGALSIFAQYHSKISKVFNIKNTAFSPPPRVQSCFIKLSLFEENPWGVEDEILFFKIVRAGFQQRRKMLKNSLATLFDEDKLFEAFNVLKLNTKCRAEELSIRQLAELSNQLN